MTESEWNSCNDPKTMLIFLRDKATDRQLSLFGVACTHRMLGLFPSAIIRRAVTFAERDADESASHEEMLQIQNEIEEWRASARTSQLSHAMTAAESSAVLAASWLVYSRPLRRMALAREVARAAAAAVYEAANDRDAIRRAPADETVMVARATWQAAHAAQASETQAQAALLRDICGNPFHPPIIDRAWLLPEVVYFARQIYEGGTFEWLPDLADTLQEAGCTNADILNHCRQPDQYVRGCGTDRQSESSEPATGTGRGRRQSACDTRGSLVTEAVRLSPE
jgi:hypothetical protein